MDNRVNPPVGDGPKHAHEWAVCCSPSLCILGACLEESQRFVPLFESASVCPFMGHWKLRNLW